MSRTYRFKKDKWLIKDQRILQDLTWIEEHCIFEYVTFSDENKIKKELALFHSDSKNGVRLNRGPSWFHNLTTQRPYRRESEIELHRFFKYDYYEVQIQSNPYRDYWD